MKKLFFLFCILSPFGVFSQKYFSDEMNTGIYNAVGDLHIDMQNTLIVRSVPYYGGVSYPEIISTFDYMMMVPISGTKPKVFSIITSINGESCRGMSPSVLYNKICSSNIINLKHVCPGDDIADSSQEHEFVYSKKQLHLEPAYNIYKKNKVRDQVSIFCDRDVDLQSYRTYDYVITNARHSEVAKKIVEVLSARVRTLKRDTENPDLIIKISFDANKGVSSSYVPENPEKGGYSNFGNTNQQYLEIAFLDAKQMKDPKQAYAPIVWSFIYNGTWSAGNSIFALAPSLIEENIWKFSSAVDYNLANIAMCGILYNAQGNIAFVWPESPAAELGLKAGDILVSVKGFPRTYNLSWREWIDKGYTGKYVYFVQRGDVNIKLEGSLFYQNGKAEDRYGYIEIPLEFCN